jgi:magnesium transporter
MGPTNEVLDRQIARREVRELQARVDAGSFRPTTAGEIAHALRVTVLRSHEELIASLARRITELERIAMQCDPMRSEPLLQDLFSVRHDLQTIRTNAAHAHEVYVRIGESGRLRGTDAQRLSDLRHGFEHARNTADLQRDYLQDLVDLFETRVATELNRFVRQLTAWGAIGLVATLIAGIYGMNFAHMPELDWTYGYPMALGSMILVGLALAAVFRRRGWL